VNAVTVSFNTIMR